MLFTAASGSDMMKGGASKLRAAFTFLLRNWAIISTGVQHHPPPLLLCCIHFTHTCTQRHATAGNKALIKQMFQSVSVNDQHQAGDSFDSLPT